MRVKCFGCDAVIVADDSNAIVDAFVAHARERHTWSYPEEAIRTYARNYADATERLTGGTERLSEIADITVHPVTEDRVDDWLRFFDHDAFAGNPDWASCYCLEPHVPDHLERAWRMTRAAVAERLRGGTTFGYLAYVDGRPAGWVNASLRADYGLYRDVDPNGPEPASVIGISCFVVAPPFRRHGIASALLDRVIADAPARGAAWIEAYPDNRPEESDAGHFRGPRSMYDARGFKSIVVRDRDTVVRLSVTPPRQDAVSRRAFLAATTVAFTARSYSRIIGANDRIQIGQIGCGHRADGLRDMLKKSAATDPHFDLRSVCDLWWKNRTRAADDAERMFGRRPKEYQYSEEMLADPELDAVMIATGDHQHAKILAEVVRAGKDCYCEKPMANSLADAKLARDTVLASTQVVQMGSQWLSCPYQHRVREIIRSGKIGKIVSISQSWNYNGPRWHIPRDGNVAAIRERETDWNRWLLGRPERPFDPRVYFEFRLFKDFSGGITDQWYSHGSGLAHFYLDTFIPDDTVSNGGIFVWHDVRENPDTFQAISTFAERQVLYTYGTTFGNAHGDHTIIRGTRGTLFSPGGEGSPQWWFVKEPYSLWGSNIVFISLHLGKYKPEPVLLPGSTDLPPIKQDDNLKAHTDNWLACMRSRQTPNGSIESGFAHSVAVIMATRSYREGTKMYWDRKREEILDHPQDKHQTDV